LKHDYKLSLNGETQLLIGDIKVLPETYFAQPKISDDTIFLHDHKLSWTSPSKRFVMKHSFVIIRFLQNWIKPVLSISTWIQFRSNKKAVSKRRDEVLDENTRDIKV
jgi:hypothetical protein